MVAIPARDTARLFARLMEQDIVTSFRDANIRATIHFYNSDDDIDTFLAAMRRHRDQFIMETE
jgi:selenocysteine lyase/cysteine desulfurase